MYWLKENVVDKQKLRISNKHANKILKRYAFCYLIAACTRNRNLRITGSRIWNKMLVSRLMRPQLLAWKNLQLKKAVSLF